MKQKVFCIGFHKTGTKSLAHALKTLRYKVTGPNGTQDENIQQNIYNLAFDLVEQYDAFQDNPWPIVYKELDKKYPHSKFIYTFREPQSWIRSQVNHFGCKETPMRKWIYGHGSPVGNEEIYLQRFEDHHHEVTRYFQNRSEDLLIMNLETGDEWKKLCSFLKVKVPSTPFPHVNKASERKKMLLSENSGSKI